MCPKPAPKVIVSVQSRECFFALLELAAIAVTLLKGVLVRLEVLEELKEQLGQLALGQARGHWMNVEVRCTVV